MPDTKVDTRRFANRRRVRLQTIDDLVAEVERLTVAAAVGRVRSLGNWSPAQGLWHIGRLIALDERIEQLEAAEAPLAVRVENEIGFTAARHLIGEAAHLGLHSKDGPGASRLP